jgi:hypothetical protein
MGAGIDRDPIPGFARRHSGWSGERRYELMAERDGAR